MDDQTFEQYYKKYHASVSRFFSNRGFVQEDANDLTQDVFLRVYKNKGQFRGEASFGTWVHQIAANVWKNQIRGDQTGKRKGIEMSFIETHVSDHKEGVTAFQELMYKDKSRQVRAAIEQFPDQMRHCIVLRTYHHLKYREIAATLKIPLETVKTQLHLARERLLQLLSESPQE